MHVGCNVCAQALSIVKVFTCRCKPNDHRLIQGAQSDTSCSNHSRTEMFTCTISPIIVNVVSRGVCQYMGKYKEQNKRKEEWTKEHETTNSLRQKQRKMSLN